MAADRDEVDPNGDGAEEEEAEPSPALRLLIEGKRTLTFALERCVIEVYAADTAPEPYDQDLLHAMLDVIEEVNNLNKLAVTFLGRRIAFGHVEDPPGYPKGTLRYDPSSPGQVKYLRETLQERGNYNRFEEVIARDGIILYAWQEGVTEGNEEDDYQETLSGLIGLAEAGQLGDIAPALFQVLRGMAEDGALSRENYERLRQLVERPDRAPVEQAGPKETKPVKKAQAQQTTQTQAAKTPPGPTAAQTSQFVPFAVRPRVEPTPAPARPPGRGDRFNAKKDKTHDDGSNKAD
jgi:hypothetical protein